MKQYKPNIKIKASGHKGARGEIRVKSVAGKKREQKQSVSS